VRRSACSTPRSPVQPPVTLGSQQIAGLKGLDLSTSRSACYAAPVRHSSALHTTSGPSLCANFLDLFPEIVTAEDHHQKPSSSWREEAGASRPAAVISMVGELGLFFCGKRPPACRERHPHDVLPHGLRHQCQQCAERVALPARSRP